MNNLIVIEDSEGAVPEKLRDSRRELTSRAELLGKWQTAQAAQEIMKLSISQSKDTSHRKSTENSPRDDRSPRRHLRALKSHIQESESEGADGNVQITAPADTQRSGSKDATSDKNESSN